MERLTEKDKHILCQKLCDTKNRCNNPNNKNYKDYGGRGIKVCSEWSDKKNVHRNFRKWAIENGWRKGLSIDRKDNNGDYEPSNCRWSTPKQQSNNMRFNRIVTINGKEKTVQEWADIVGISQRAMTGRIESGWSEEDLLKPKYKPLKMTKAEMSKEIRMWRGLKEQGKPIELPCAVGDTVYYADNEYYFTVLPVKVDEISIMESNAILHKCLLFDGNGDVETQFDFDKDDFGKTVFLTRQEAEDKLAEMEGKK